MKQPVKNIGERKRGKMFQKGDLVEYVGLRNNHDPAYLGVVIKVTELTAGNRAGGSALVYWSSLNKKILTSFCYMRKIA